MIESQGTTPDQVSTDPLGEALAKVAELEAKLDLSTESVETWRQNYYDSQDTILKARKYIEDTLSGDVNAQQTYEDFQVPFELLGVEATREVSISISVTWAGTIDLPFGVEVHDLDIDDFGLNEPEHNEYSSNMGYHGIRDYSIDER